MVVGLDAAACLQVLGIGASLALVSALAAMILLGARKTVSACRSNARVQLLGVRAAWILHFGWQLPDLRRPDAGRRNPAGRDPAADGCIAMGAARECSVQGVWYLI